MIGIPVIVGNIAVIAWVLYLAAKTLSAIFEKYDDTVEVWGLFRSQTNRDIRDLNSNCRTNDREHIEYDAKIKKLQDDLRSTKEIFLRMSVPDLLEKVNQKKKKVKKS